MRGMRPPRQFLGIVIEPIRDPPVRRQFMLAVLGRVAEGSESLPLEGRYRFGVGFEIDHLARNQRDHPLVHEHAGAAKHAADRYRSELDE